MRRLSPLVLRITKLNFCYARDTPGILPPQRFVRHACLTDLRINYGDFHYAFAAPHAAAHRKGGRDGARDYPVSMHLNTCLGRHASDELILANA